MVSEYTSTQIIISKSTATNIVNADTFLDIFTLYKPSTIKVSISYTLFIGNIRTSLLIMFIKFHTPMSITFTILILSASLILAWKTKTLEILIYLYLNFIVPSE